MPLVWYFQAGYDKVKQVKLDEKTMCKQMKKMMGIRTLGWTVFEDPDSVHPVRHQYTIWCNDTGIWDDQDKPLNTCAMKVLGKLPIKWGTFKGDFFVSLTVFHDDEEDEEKAEQTGDMSISFLEFIDKGKRAMGASHLAREKEMELFKAMGGSVITLGL